MAPTRDWYFNRETAMDYAAEHGVDLATVALATMVALRFRIGAPADLHSASLHVYLRTQQILFIYIAWFGLLLVVFGALANPPDAKRRMLFMHIAVTVGLLGFLAATHPAHLKAMPMQMHRMIVHTRILHHQPIPLPLLQHRLRRFRI